MNSTNLTHSPRLLLFLTIFFTWSFRAQVTDYGILSNWAVHPSIKNSELNAFISDSTNHSKIDVFYLYPTLFLDKNDPRWNIPVSDSVQQSKVLSSAVKFQASAFAEGGRMFVPFYRQANIRAYRQMENGGKEALLIAYSDIRAAFSHYLKYYNKGRPILLAGHSQGSTHITLLLKEFFDDKPLQKQLIAAYIPGIGLSKDEFCSIQLMTEPTQTGGFVSWNTFKRKISKEKYEMWYKGKCVVNPVTWTLDELAQRSLHKGFLFSNGKLYEKSFNTHLIDGALWISTPHFPYRSLSWTMDDYHIGDVNLFWKDIRENVELRIKSYEAKQ